MKFRIKLIGMFVAALMVFGGTFVITEVNNAEPADALAAGISGTGGRHVWVTASYADAVNLGWSKIKSTITTKCAQIGGLAGVWTAAAAYAVCAYYAGKFIEWAKTKINGSRAGNHGVWFEFYLRTWSPFRYGTW